MQTGNGFQITVEGLPVVEVTGASWGELKVLIRSNDTGMRHLYVHGHLLNIKWNDANRQILIRRGYVTGVMFQGELGDSLAISKPGISRKIKPPASRPAPKPAPLPPPPVTAEQKVEPSPPAAEQKSAPLPAAPALPNKTAAELVGEHTSLNFLDEEALGRTLLDYARQGNLSKVDETLDELGSTDRDDVSLQFVNAASDENLAKLAETEEGRKLLLRLYDELTSGALFEGEALAAERIMKARAQRIDPQKFIEADQKATVIPFSGVGFTKLSSASLSVRRLSNGKISIRSHMKPEHWKDARRLPSMDILIGSGIEVDPDQVVGLYLYDEGGKTIYVPAIYLLQLSNQETTKVYQLAGEAIFTGLTLGVGGEVAAAGEASSSLWVARGLTALKWADRAAAAIGVASTLINDHRGLILKYFGKDGEVFLKHWQTVERVVLIYGLARGAVALGQTVVSLRGSYQNWRNAQAQLSNLSKEEKTTLDNIARETEKSLHDLENAQQAAAAGKTANVLENVTEDTRELLKRRPELREVLEQSPRAAKILKRCASPCYPDFASATQIDRIETLLEQAEGAGIRVNEKNLTTFLRDQKDWTKLDHAIDALERDLQLKQGVLGEFGEAGQWAKGNRIVPAGRPSTGVLRGQPGQATGAEGLAVVTGKWFPPPQKGATGIVDPRVAPFPGQIARKMQTIGNFKSFDEFRETFWKLVASDPALSQGWSAANLQRMRAGLAPRVPAGQAVGGGSNAVYQLNHKLAIKNSGEVYNMQNIEIVSPAFHGQIGD